MSFLCRLRLACLGLALIAASSFPAAAKTPGARTPLSSLVIQLDNGQKYSLSKKELKDKKGGVIFWGDWAVYNLLVPYHFFNRQNVGPDDVIRLWTMPGRSGQLPGFLVLTADGPIYPLDPGGPNLAPTVFSYNPRPAAISVQVGLEDGRSYYLSQEELYDGKSGVLFWGDNAVKNILVPFYVFAANLPTSPTDVLNLWDTTQAASAPASATSAKSISATMTASRSELPAFIVKPRCIPGYPLD